MCDLRHVLLQCAGLVSPSSSVQLNHKLFAGTATHKEALPSVSEHLSATRVSKKQDKGPLSPCSPPVMLMKAPVPRGLQRWRERGVGAFYSANPRLLQA